MVYPPSWQGPLSQNPFSVYTEEPGRVYLPLSHQCPLNQAQRSFLDLKSQNEVCLNGTIVLVEIINSPNIVYLGIKLAVLSFEVLDVLPPLSKLKSIQGKTQELRNQSWQPELQFSVFLHTELWRN